jgi:hypothetical protein
VDNLAVIGLMLWWGCTGTPTPPQLSLAEQINQLEDPIARLAALDEVMSEHPERIPGLCVRLEDRNTAERCQLAMKRPHLYADHPSTSTNADAAPGPRGSYSAPTQLPKPPVVEPAQAPQRCPVQLAPDGCASLHARRAAQAGDMERTYAMCARIEDDRWEQECLFSAAEARGASARQSDWETAYADSVTLCAAAEAFTADCLRHLISAPGARGLSANSLPEQWAPIRRRIAMVESYWSSRDPGYGQIATGRMWFDALHQAYQRTTPLTGQPMTHLPEDAHPHIRSTIALQLVARDPDPTRSLSDWAALFDDVLAKRSIGRAASQQPTPLASRDIWPEDGPGESAIPTVAFVGAGRRPTSADPAVDARIALLEAILRACRDCSSALRDGLDDDDPMVQQTAKRLLQVEQPADGGPAEKLPGLQQQQQRPPRPR